MLADRRTVLAVGASLVAWPARGQDPSPVFTGYERESGGRIGVYAENLVTGTQLAWRADERFVMCSTFKLSLAACVLTLVDGGRDRLESMIAYGPADLQPYAPAARQHLVEGAMSVLDMCKAVVELSDNTCANLLLARVGGPPALTAFWRRTGDDISRLDHNEPVLNRSPPGDPHDTTTPRAMARTLRRLVVGDVLTPTSRARLIAWAVNCATGANRLRRGLPASRKIGDKTGNNSVDAAGDIAMAWPRPGTPISICVYTQGGTPTPPQWTAVFADIGRLVAQRLG